MMKMKEVMHMITGNHLPVQRQWGPLSSDWSVRPERQWAPSHTDHTDQDHLHQTTALALNKWPNSSLSWTHKCLILQVPNAPSDSTSHYASHPFSSGVLSSFCISLSPPPFWKGHGKQMNSPGRIMPEEMHSKMRRRASPGLMLGPPLLTHFSTNSSMACTQSHHPSAHTERNWTEDEETVGQREVDWRKKYIFTPEKMKSTIRT